MENISLRQRVFAHMVKNPYTSNTDIQLKFKKESSNSVKTYRTQWLKENKVGTKKGVLKSRTAKTDDEKFDKMTEEEIKEFLKKGGYTKIDEATIEAIYLEAANTGDTSLVNLARGMTEFYIKIKGKIEELDEDIDMEMLKQIGINVKSID